MKRGQQMEEGFFDDTDKIAVEVYSISRIF